MPIFGNPISVPLNCTTNEGMCENRNELCEFIPLPHILCNQEKVNEQCPRTCNSCPETRHFDIRNENATNIEAEKEKQEFPLGCHMVPPSQKCCEYIDGRRSTDYYLEPCVNVVNVQAPVRDKEFSCQPLCWANNQCGDEFKEQFQIIAGVLKQKF